METIVPGIKIRKEDDPEDTMGWYCSNPRPGDIIRAHQWKVIDSTYEQDQIGPYWVEYRWCKTCGTVMKIRDHPCIVNIGEEVNKKEKTVGYYYTEEIIGWL